MATDAPDRRDAAAGPASVVLLWIPLGAGQRVVRASGKLFEAVSASVRRRRRCDLYHSALVVDLADAHVVIEMAPMGVDGERRGVVGGGPVGMRWAGHFRLFRYEVRRWRDGIIPDADHAVAALTVSVDPTIARRILELVPAVPTVVWGRDELGAGEMWNSNSITSWLLARSDVDTTTIEHPPGGRAPGWRAGIVVAARDRTTAADTAGLTRR